MNKKDYFEDIKTYKYLANKSLGQNFLIVPDVAEQIINLLEIKESDEVLEIGAGLGSLSYFLAQKNSKTTLIDVDERMIYALSQKFENKANIEIKRENILKSDLNKYTKIVGNLPYYITSGIIEYVLLNALHLTKAVFMVQKEVYQKFNNKKEISPLSMFMKYVGNVSAGKIVNRNCFTPVPHVDSAYFSITLNENIKNPDNKVLLNLMNKMFIYRRKTILNCLTNILGNKEESEKIIAQLNLDTNLRPEQLDINDYINLLNVLKSKDFISKIM